MSNRVDGMARPEGHELGAARGGGAAPSEAVVDVAIEALSPLQESVNSLRSVNTVGSIIMQTTPFLHTMRKVEELFIKSCTKDATLPIGKGHPFLAHIKQITGSEWPEYFGSFKEGMGRLYDLYRAIMYARIENRVGRDRAKELVAPYRGTEKAAGIGEVLTMRLYYHLMMLFDFPTFDLEHFKFEEDEEGRLVDTNPTFLDGNNWNLEYKFPETPRYRSYIFKKLLESGKPWTDFIPSKEEFEGVTIPQVIQSIPNESFSKGFIPILLSEIEMAKQARKRVIELVEQELERPVSSLETLSMADIVFQLQGKTAQETFKRRYEFTQEHLTLERGYNSANDFIWPMRLYPYRYEGRTTFLQYQVSTALKEEDLVFLDLLLERSSVKEKEFYISLLNQAISHYQRNKKSNSASGSDIIRSP